MWPRTIAMAETAIASAWKMALASERRARDLEREEERMSEAQRPMTYGEKAVGLDFNPSGDPAVAHLKQLFAEVIDHMDELRNGSKPGEQARLASIAITEAQGAQMWAVKAATWRHGR